MTLDLTLGTSGDEEDLQRSHIQDGRRVAVALQPGGDQGADGVQGAGAGEEEGDGAQLQVQEVPGQAQEKDRVLPVSQGQGVQEGRDWSSQCQFVRPVEGVRRL